MAALELRDFFSFAPSAGRAGGSSADPGIREAAKAGKGLKVTFAASHAGMVNGNNVMYSPRGMKDCSHTWVWPQRQPIQVHHDDHADPIGRVIGARYSGYDQGDVSQGQADALNIFRDNFRLSRDNVVEVAKALEDSKVLGDSDWRGVGELLLDGIVTDADAVEKILDGRYQGVSITQRPQQAFCSLCGTDWVADGQCEHERGEKDEESGRVMYLVVGDTEYAEVSYVNRPADKHAMGVETQPLNDVPDITTQLDEKTDTSSILDRSMQTIVSFQLVDSLDEETGMAQKKEDKTTGDGNKPEEQDIQNPTKDIQDKQDKPEENSEPDPVVNQDTVSEEVETSEEQDSEASDGEENNSSDPPEDDSDSSDPELTVEEALKCLFEDRDNLTGFMCDLLFDAIEELVEEQDAKLSTKKRKSLPSSSFCGPNRSFPVNDCAHYTAAKRLIGRYKGPGSKDSIMSCIERKGKAMGCSTSKDEQDEEMVSTEGITLETMSDKLLAETLLATEKAMADRGLKAERKCDNCDSLQTQVDQLKDSVPELQDTVKVLREEWKTVTGEHTASEDAHAVTLSEFEDSLRSFALVVSLLTDKDTNEDDLKAKINGLTFEDLKNITKETDISEVISFVRSGLTQEPEETVTQDDAEAEEKTSADPVVKLSESLAKIYKDHGFHFASTVMNDWLKAGKLPEDFTLDKAFELVAK